VQQVKGAVLKSRLAFVEEIAGKSGVDRVLGALSAEDRKALGLVLPPIWYPFPLGERLDGAIVKVIGGGNPRFFEKLGEESATRNLSTLHRMYLTPGDPHAFLEKAPAIYRSYYDTGHREYERTGPQSGTLTTHEAVTFSAPDCLTVLGWYRKALEMCGATNVSVIEEECRAKGGEVCRYSVAWK